MAKTLDQMTLAELGDELNNVVVESRNIFDKAEKDGRTKETLLPAEEEAINKLADQIVPIKEQQKKKTEFQNRLGVFDGLATVNPRKTPSQQQKDMEKIVWQTSAAKHLPREYNRSAKYGCDEYQVAFSSYLKGRDPAMMAGSTGMSVSEDERGGYFVASEAFSTELIKNVDDAVHMQAMSRVIMMPPGTQSYGLRVRRNKASSAIWGNENTDMTGIHDRSLSYGKRVLTPNWLLSSAIISKELVRNFPGAEGMVLGELGINNAEVIEQAALTGDGNMKPLGCLVPSDDGIDSSRDMTSGEVANFTFDDFVALKYNLKPKYRPTAKWLLHRLMLKNIALLKDGEGRYLWQPSRVLGEPDQILGLGLTESEWMPSAMTTAAYYTILGNFEYYYFIYDMQMSMQRLNEMGAFTNEFIYLLRMKMDAAPILAEAFTRGVLG